MEAFETQLKAISFLPYYDSSYEQAPYEEITKERYIEMESGLKKPDFSSLFLEPEGERFCTNDSCTI